MGNPPAQNPNINLPGAEFFSLSPNRTIALQGRRRRFLSSATATIPAGAEGSSGNGLVIETGFTATSGIYLHVANLTMVPFDNTGELQITASRLALGLNPTPPATGDPAFDLGIPAATLLAPAANQVIITDRDKLITQQDILLGYGANPGPTGALTFNQVIFVKNLDATNPHSFVCFSLIVYSRLDGIVE